MSNCQTGNGSQTYSYINKNIHTISMATKGQLSQSDMKKDVGEWLVGWMERALCRLVPTPTRPLLMPLHIILYCFSHFKKSSSSTKCNFTRSRPLSFSLFRSIKTVSPRTTKKRVQPSCNEVSSETRKMQSISVESKLNGGANFTEEEEELENELLLTYIVCHF